MVTAATTSAPLIEKHTIGYVPPEDRHGKTRDLFTLWFGGNIAPLPIVTGALGVQMFHLNLVWGIVAILVGHLVGGVLMALHSAQGPQMGIPQMIQSRAQFGSLGALLVVLIAGVMYIGFFASNIVLAGKSLHGVVDSVPVPVGIVIGALGSGIIGIIGYRFIHVLNRIGTWVLGAGIVLGFGYIFTHVQTADFLTRGSFNISGWLATVSLAALWQIAFAPYVSDYSRYLPANVPVAATFWTTYLGTVLGSSLSFIFGAVAVLATPVGMDTMDAVKLATGSIGPLMLVLFLLSVISHNALNLYGAVLSLITLVQTFAYRWIPTARSRAVLSVIVLAACCLLLRRRRRLGQLHRPLRRHGAGAARGAGAVDRDQPDRLLCDSQRSVRYWFDLQGRRRHLRPLQPAGVAGVCDRDRGADSVHEHAAVRRSDFGTHQWCGFVLAGRPADHLAALLLAGEP
ncbi:nucleobase:cation symporter-1, NCS1 family [Pseudomonas arsenicoxydans]|uniref:Nucleobase:cation symporter-1, NCS1 family n=1 Tax=Pseudomonas arsenicoxydans TaxID=702115 RepID=A0A1H0M0I7_9PSED|nr:nucleobase:cation symporter-1, NCS1 family [Pseudomonas arsenicoxydans]